MARDLATEPMLPSGDIQGDILVGLKKKYETMLFFSIEDADEFKDFLKGLDLTSQADSLAIEKLIEDRKAQGINTLVPTPGLNVAFTYRGLVKLGVDELDDADVEAFRDGMAARTEKGVLTDPPPAEWSTLGPNCAVDGVFLVTGATQAEIATTIALQLAPVPGNGWVIDQEQHGQVRPDPVAGHEHFGYADGVSQPGVRGVLPDGEPLTPNANPGNDDQGEPGQDLLWPGEFLFGYPEQDAGKPLEEPGDVHEPPAPFMRNGAYLVIRRLSQRVPEFDQAVKKLAKLTGGASDAASADLLGAQMVGRWKSGAALINTPKADDASIAEGTPNVNDFEFGDDREGLRCPWAAHVRKVYPRDDVRHNLTPTEEDADAAESFTQTHRMMRRGIAFGPELTEQEARSGCSDSQYARGLLFKCYVTSIEDQFEFVQQHWVNAEGFSQQFSGVDPIIGQSSNGTAPFLGAAPFSENAGHKPQLAMGHFVNMEGGEYFFAPALGAIAAL